MPCFFPTVSETDIVFLTVYADFCTELPIFSASSREGLKLQSLGPRWKSAGAELTIQSLGPQWKSVLPMYVRRREYIMVE